MNVNERGGAKDALTTKMKTLSAEANALSATATRMVQIIDEALSKGENVSVQPQMMFLTGALMRMTKDLGVVEHLQQLGFTPRKPSK
jgi:hypothetical protein